MTHITIVEEMLVVQVQGLDKLWAFKSELRIPLGHVCSVAPAADEARRVFRGMRAPGTHVPGLITAGTYYASEGRVFWDVHTSNNAIAIVLRDNHYAKLVIEVEDPAAEIGRIEAAIAARAAFV